MESPFPELGVGFLISDVGRLMRQRLDQRARELGLTRAQWQVLVHLARNEGATQATLADLLEIEPITLSRQIDRMEDAGLVSRAADPNDRRVWLIHMSPRARDLLDQLRGVGRSVLAEALDGLPAETVQRMTEGLHHLRTTLSARPGPTAAMPAELPGAPQRASR